MNREIKKIVKENVTSDGAGVKLVRVLGIQTVDAYDPFLMLDSFDSKNPSDYIKGFPMHPHRGIETVTYLSSGGIRHKDTMGNSGYITGGGVQWMTAGSGLEHEEMPQESDRLMGVQLWVNLPKKFKMTEPSYYDIPKSSIPTAEIEGGTLDIIAGEFEGIKGHQGQYVPVTFYAIHLAPHRAYTLPTKMEDNGFLFTLEGSLKIAGQETAEKSAALLTEGTQVELETGDNPAEVLYIAGPRLDEPVAWGGPIVMNTEEELRNSFREYQNGTFIKERAAKGV